MDRPHRRVKVANYKSFRSGKVVSTGRSSSSQKERENLMVSGHSATGPNKTCRLLSHQFRLLKSPLSRNSFRALCYLQIRRFRRKSGSDRPSGMDRGPGVCPRLPILWPGARWAHLSPTHWPPRLPRSEECERSAQPGCTCRRKAIVRVA